MLLNRLLQLHLVIFFLLPFQLKAQLSFSTISDKQKIGLTEHIQVQFIAENAGSIEDFTPPPFKHFTVLQGPIETSGMSLVNGEMSRYKALTYIIRPTKKGTLTVSGATAEINGKKMKSNDLRIEVGDAVTKPANPYPIDPGVGAFRREIQEEYLLEHGEKAEEKIKSNLQVVLDLDKTTAYIGEPIVATYKLLTRLRSDSRISKRPSMNGFSVYDMIEPDGMVPTVEERNGTAFQAHIIRKTQLFPLQEGTFVMEPIELDNNVRFLRKGSNSGNSNRSSIQQLMEELMGEESGNWEQHRLMVASEPRTITILPLPENAPKSFSGAVGEFELKGNATSTTVAAGDNFTYTLEISGKGNLPLMNAPEWEMPASFTLYDPTVTEELKKEVSPMEGKKIITYTITPSEKGSYTLPGITMSYFDPVKKTYKTIQTDSIQLTVTPSLNRTIPAPSIPEEKPAILSSGKLLIIAFGLLLFILMAWLILSRKKSSRSNAVSKQNPEPIELSDLVFTPIDYLAAARNELEKDQVGPFYKELEKGLWELLAMRFQLSPSEWQKEKVIPLLRQSGLEESAVQNLLTIWQRCEWALYAPSMVSEERADIWQQANEFVTAIDQLKT